MSDPMPSAEVLLEARDDVSAEKHGDKFIINDPVKHTFIQLGVGEYLVFRCFDGKSTVADIAERMKRERDVIVSVASVERLRDRLHEKQLLVGHDEQVVGAENPLGGRSLLQRLLVIDLRMAIDPDRFLTRLYHRIKRWVFRPAFFVCLFLATCVALQVWITSWDTIRHQLSVLDIRQSLVMFYACTVISILIHEIGHGVSTKGFGGTVPRMGAFLYFFVLVFYTDVSASWMFTSKFRRLMVLFAGAITNLVQWTVWTVVWRVTLPGTLVNQVSLVFMVINVVNLSFTLFPLLRGDGYFIVSTALDIPNLSQSSHRYVGARLRKRFVDKTTVVPKATRREALIYLIFSPLQVLFFCVFFLFIATRTAEWLIDSFGFLGFWIIVLVVADRIARPLFRIVPATLALAAEALRVGLSEGVTPLLGVLTRPLRAAGRWIVRMWRIELIAAAVLVVVSVIPYELHINAPFEVISSGPVAVRPKTSGIIRAFRVKTGDWVKAGDVVAVLVDDDLELARRGLAAAVVEAKARLAEFEAGYRREQVESAEVGVHALRRKTALAAAERKRLQTLFTRQVASRSELDTAEHAYATAIARERRARAELTLLHHGYRQEDRDRARALVQRAECELAAVEQQLEWTKVRAPAGGRVITPPLELERRVGKHVAIGDDVVEVVAPAQLVARLEVPERFAGEVGVGMPVTLRFFQDPGAAYETRIDAVELTVTVRDQQPGIGLLSRIGDFDGVLPVGAKGIAKIDAGSRSILRLIVDRTTLAAWVVFWSWW